ncbi:hypothetical protein [Lutibacter sp.]|uniref:hypothetical protein n=1 Tax=Lutibacter sp. TaxID=1925666 RepID=UPI00356A5E0F
MRTYKYLSIILVGFFILSCGGGGDDDDPTPPPKNPPDAAVLVAPAQNSECNQGTNVTATKSDVTFEWRIAANTDLYELTVKNLKTGVSTNYTSTTNIKMVTLDRATPYSWRVISKSNSVSQTASSLTWKFYNAGDGTISYPPFPAEIIAPEMGAFVTASNGKVDLKWAGSAVENNIAGYDIYFAAANPPSLHKANHTSTELTGIAVTANTIYYWKIITKDSKGNSSDSGIYNFKIN